MCAVQTESNYILDISEFWSPTIWKRPSRNSGRCSSVLVGVVRCSRDNQETSICRVRGFEV